MLSLRMQRLVVAASVASATACSEQAPSEHGSSYHSTSAGLAQSALSTEVAGYVHGLSATRFPLGTNALQRDEFGMHKTIVDQGVFATRATGQTIVRANASAAVRQRPRFQGSVADHNALVRSYFIGAGLPSAQVANVEDREVIGMGGNGPLMGPTKGAVLFYNSIIKRQLSGVPVPDSYAWAHFNEDGDVVEEGVYWPPIPASVVQDALALVAQLADTSRRAAFMRLINAVDTGQAVVIHHTPGVWDGSFVAVATVDVTRGGDFPATVHFNSSGVPVTLPHETSGAWGAPAPSFTKP